MFGYGGFGGGYGYGGGGCGYGGYGFGGGFALIVVLFILLIIVGAACFTWQYSAINIQISNQKTRLVNPAGFLVYLYLNFSIA